MTNQPRSMDSAAPRRSSRLKRVSAEPAFLLHQYAWSESSAIVELFTREHGRISAIAKGAKKPTSNFRSVLLPLQFLQVDYSYTEVVDSEICTIRGVEWIGGYAMPQKDALLAGLYLNELLLRLLVRGDKHLRVFDAFAATVRVLATQPQEMLEPLLRAFELVMLRELGLLPDLSIQTMTSAAIEPRGRYALIPEVGLHSAPEQGHALRGQQWLELHAALQSDRALALCMEILSGHAHDLKRQIRAALAHYLGGDLQTQRLMRGMRSL